MAEFPHPESLSVRSRNGVPLHSEILGQGPSMFLCNGLYCSTHYYVLWREYFSQHHRVVEFDYRGHGKSGDPPNPARVSMEDLAADAQDVFDKTCTEGKTIVVGHSMGARVALELAARVPQQVSCVILLCGSVFDSLGPVPSRFPLRQLTTGTLRLGHALGPVAGWIKNTVVDSGIIMQVGYMLGGLSRTLTPREPVEGLLRNLRRLDMRLMSSLGRSYIGHTARPLLSSIRVPTLVFAGEKDLLAPPSHARQVARMLPDAEVVICPGCTHLASIERPDLVHREVEAFLRRRSLA